MITPRSPFSRLSIGQNRLREWIPSNKPRITLEQTQSRDSLFERAVTMEEYFAEPRARSFADELAYSRQEVERLRQELEIAKYHNQEESQLGSVLVNVIGQIVELSERLFPGPIAIEYSYDPENPSDEFLVFDVVARGEYKDYCEQEFQWHEEVRKIVPGTLGEFRLCIMPQR